MDTTKQTALEALEAAKGIVSTACTAIGLPRRTFYQWKEDDPEFKAAVDEIQEYTLDVVESKLLSRIDKDDTTAIIFYMKTKGKKRGYIERQELSGIDGRDLFSSKSDEELKALLNKLTGILNEPGGVNTGHIGGPGAA